MTERKAASGIAATFDIRRSSFAKSGWLARMSGTYLRSDLCGVRRAPGSCERAGSGPHQLQSRKDRDHRDSRLQPARWNFARE